MIKNQIYGLFRSNKIFVSSLRILIPLYSTYLIFGLSIFFIFVPMQKKQMIDQKKQMIHELTESVCNFLSEYEQRIKKGDLTSIAARKIALKRIRNIRYGPEGKDYFWILNMQNRVIMHPYMPDIEDKAESDFKDSQGKQLYESMVNKARKHGSGYINYSWQWKDDPKKIVPKISYVKIFTPWGWVVGTGVYIEDIEREISSIIKGFLNIFTGVLFIIILMSFYITFQIIKVEKKKSVAEKEKELEELRLKKLLILNQMTGASLKELTEFALEEAIKLTQSEIGYLAFISEDETELKMHTWSKGVMEKCGVSDKTMIYQLKDTGLWAESAKSRKAEVINDYQNYVDPAKKGYPKGHVHISRVMNIPVIDGEKIVAVAGVGNKNEDYNESDVRQLQLMVEGMWKIIQKKNSEDALRESEQRYKMLADNTTDNIWVFHISSFSLTYTSPSVERLLGFTSEEMLDLEMERYVTKGSIEELTSVIDEELEKDHIDGTDPKRHRVIEMEQLRKDGSKIWTEVTASFLRDSDGNPDRILGVTRDITERKQLEKRLQHVQKMESLGTLAGGIAHDFNNILSAVLGFTELAKLGNVDEKTIRNLDQVLTAGLRAKDLVNHILTFSRGVDVEKRSIKITPIIKECIKFLRSSVSANIEIQRELDDSDILIKADSTQIHQVVMNLFTNAAYAMKNTGGVIDIQLKTVEVSSDEIFQAKELKPGRYLKLTVADTGCGIPKDIIGRVFEPFFTSKGRTEGTGMGLSTAYGIVKDMGGYISVYSEPDLGTTFQVLFPEHKGKAVTDDSYLPSEPEKGKGKILLVDDEIAIVEWTYQVLLKLGYEVESTTGSIEALEKFTKRPNDFDLILTDMSMPNMDGVELSSRILEINPDIPILLCTGFSEGLTYEMIKNIGISNIIMKPMIASELAQEVSKVLKKKI